MAISILRMVATHQQPYRIVADPRLRHKTRDGLRQSLLSCERDTLALARVHQWLMQES